MFCSFGSSFLPGRQITAAGSCTHLSAVHPDESLALLSRLLTPSFCLLSNRKALAYGTWQVWWAANKLCSLARIIVLLVRMGKQRQRAWK